MDRLRLLKELSFGARVAEEETSALGRYFVETDQWNRIVKGEIDIIRGDKGAGKSAIYSLLIARSDQFFDENILLVSGEKPRGTPVFKGLVAEPPTSEVEFIGLWKLYIVVLLAQKLKEFSVENVHSKQLFRHLEGEGLLKPDQDISTLFRSVVLYARRWFHPGAIETQLTADAVTSIPIVSLKITPSEAGHAKDGVAIDTLLALSNKACRYSGLKIWILLDRLDVAFAETHALEANALRALFRVYLDMLEYEHLELKIFLRSDIWRRISEGGFREASHVTRFVILEWSAPALLNLIMRRILDNKIIAIEYGIDTDAVLKDFEAQRVLFYRLFPTQVEQGSKRPSTLDWIVSRCADAANQTAPRELIHLFTAARDQEVLRLERGEAMPDDQQVFDRSVFKAALPAVSEARLIQNLYAEYPELKKHISALAKGKTEQTIDTLADLWSSSTEDAMETATRLVDIGFFQLREVRAVDTYWVPFLFRDALKMSQGLAEDIPF